jgi:hypothetical protein
MHNYLGSMKNINVFTSTLLCLYLVSVSLYIIVNHNKFHLIMRIMSEMALFCQFSILLLSSMYCDESFTISYVL